MSKEVMKYAEYEVTVLIGKIEKICTSLQNAKDSLTSVKEMANSLEGLNLSTDTVLSNIDKYLQEINSVVSDINSFTREYEGAEKKNFALLNELLKSGITFGTNLFVDATHKMREILLSMQDSVMSNDRENSIFTGSIFFKQGTDIEYVDRYVDLTIPARNPDNTILRMAEKIRSIYN